MSAMSNNRDYLLMRAYESGIRNPRELAMFMGQMEIESGRFQSMHEDLHYRGERLLRVFHGRNGMNTLEEANAIARGGLEAVANAMYGGDWGRQKLGNTEHGDGWQFHGRGYVHLTGRNNYERVGRELGLDLVANPDIAADRSNAASIAIRYWQDRVVNKGHQNDFNAATEDINGGHNGLAERRDAVSRWERMLTPEVMERLSRGEVSLGRTERHAQQTTPSARDDGVLRQGERGQPIQRLQESLIKLGYHDAQGRLLHADGHFGARTEEALRSFQHDHGLTVDGVAGPKTLQSMERAVRTPQSTELPSRHETTREPMVDGVLGEGGRGQPRQQVREMRTPIGYYSPDGIVPNFDRPVDPRIEEALCAVRRDRPNTPKSIEPAEKTPQLNNPCHHDHPMYLQAQAGVRKLDAQHNRTPDILSDQMAAALVVEAKREGLTRIDDVVLGTSKENVFAQQRGTMAMFDQYAQVNTATALHQPIVRSSEQLEQVNQELSQKASVESQRQQQDQTREQTPGRLI